MLTPMIAEGAVQIEGSHGTLQLSAHGDHLRLEIPREIASERPPVAFLQRAHDTLDKIGLRLDLVMADRVVGSMGRGTRPSLLARVAGVGPMEVRWFSLLRARI